MADLDSRSKRASSAGLLAPWFPAPPAPDGTIAQADRQHIAMVYSGILAVSSAEALSELFYLLSPVELARNMRSMVEIAHSVLSSVALTASMVSEVGINQNMLSPIATTYDITSEVD